MAMDNRSSIFSLYNNGLYSSSDQSLNVPLHSSPGLSQISPYLNVDPSYLQTQPEFLTLEGATQQRGRFELAFSQIGGMCMTGATIGGAQGIYRGLKETSNAGLVGKIKRTQMLNYFMKGGSATSHILGTVAVMYAGFGCLFWYIRDKKEDPYNSVAAATVTGLLYKSTSGLKKCLAGGVVGLGLGLAVMVYSHKDRLRQQYARY